MKASLAALCFRFAQDLTGIPIYILTKAASFQVSCSSMDDQQLCDPAIMSEEAQKRDEDDNRNNNEDNEELEQQTLTTNQCSMPR